MDDRPKVNDAMRVVQGMRGRVGLTARRSRLAARPDRLGVALPPTYRASSGLELCHCGRVFQRLAVPHPDCTSRLPSSFPWHFNRSFLGFRDPAQ
jgi:hypothetical protein